jgi:homoserine O-acetyltransferase
MVTDSSIPAGSVGIVSPLSARFDTPLTLRSGAVLPGFDLMYETYGTLNGARSNAVLVCPALSGHHHAAGVHADAPDNAGWWDNLIGPGKPLDTDEVLRHQREQSRRLSRFDRAGQPQPRHRPALGRRFPRS